MLTKAPDGPEVEDQAPARSAAVRTTTCTRSPSPTVPSPLNEGRAHVLRPSAT